MALDGTLTGLKATVAEFLNRSDLTSTIGTFVTLAEAQMQRRIAARANAGLSYPRRMVKRADTSISTSDEYVAVPSDMFGPLSLILETSPITPLVYLDPTNFEDKKAENQWSGAPRFYTVIGSEFRIYPVADQAYTGELRYLFRIPTLTDAAANFIMTDYPDAYLYGALTASAPYLKDDDRTTVWATLFQNAIEDMCNADPTPAEMTTLKTELASLNFGGSAYRISSDTF